MIHMSQVKVSLEQILKEAPADMVKRGRIGDKEEALVKKSAAKLLRISPLEIQNFQINKKSLDARKKNQIHYIYNVYLTCAKEEKRVKQYGKNDIKWIPEEIHKSSIPMEKVEKGECSPIIVGFGPAGMFAALELARAGRMPRVIERGMDVDARQDAVNVFWKGGTLNPESNVQFGEGGAGTFSDGKLNTLVKDSSGRNKRVLETFVNFGAPSEILYLQKPHIGTDCLKSVVKAIREEIISLGGTISFETRLDDILIEDGRIVKVIFTCQGKKYEEPCSQLILATGHSARDTFYQLKKIGLNMEPKAFALGVRIEHPQDMIGQNQYGAFYKKLPTADYKVTYQTKEKRGVYSFCMCPGGFVVNASSEPERLAVNGMSYYNRDGRNANGAIVVTVSPEDYGSRDVLAGVEYQRKLEEAAYREANGKIPVQLFGDFLNHQVSTSFGEVMPAIKGEYSFGNVRSILPKVIGDSIAEGILAFDRKIKGYAREDAVLSGIESRTSSPVRMIRDESLQANIKGIYPCGEGAGYAGGITSAAMDGIRVAEKIIHTKMES